MGKRMITVLSAVLMIAGFSGCATMFPAGNEKPPTVGTTASQNNSVQPTPTQTPFDDSEEEGIFSVVIKGEPTYFYKGVLTEINGTTGVVEFVQIKTAIEESISGADLQGPITAKQIEIYEVSLSQNAGDVYVIDGTVKGLRMSVEGGDAAKFKDAMQQTNPDDKLMARVFRGETLLVKEEIEQWNNEIDIHMQFVCSARNGIMEVQEFTREYDAWIMQTPTKEVYSVENGVIRTLEVYENNELVIYDTYRADGTHEKRIYYSNGEEASIVNYDEKGNEIK